MSEYKPQYGDGTQAPYDAPGERRGMSGCAKAFLIIGVLGVGGLLVCCVGGWFYFRNAVVTDPVEVKAVANEIVDWEFNDELNGQLSMKFLGLFRVALFADPDKGFMMVVDSKYADAKDMGRQMDGQFRSQMETNDQIAEDTETIEEGEREVVIKGETVQLQFDKTRGKDSDKEYWEVVGVVPGTDYPTFVMLQVLADVYDEDEIISRFENIK